VVDGSNSKMRKASSDRWSSTNRSVMKLPVCYGPLGFCETQVGHSSTCASARLRSSMSKEAAYQRSTLPLLIEQRAVAVREPAVAANPCSSPHLEFKQDGLLERCQRTSCTLFRSSDERCEAR
jgi:hypothetical protein